MPLTALLALLIGSPSAQAGVTVPRDRVPIVHDVDATTAATLPGVVAERTGLPAEQLATVDLDQLLDAPPQVLGDAVLRRCTGQPTTMAQVEAELVRAEASWEDRQRVDAFDRLDLAVAQLGCLGEIVRPALASRIFLLRGSLEAERAAEQGKADTVARGELRTALSLQPDLRWSMSLPVDGERLLAEERAGDSSANVLIAPRGTTSGPWLDGTAVPGDGSGLGVRPGLHLAQYATPAGIRSAWLVADADAVLVLPGAFRPPILDDLLDPERQRQVGALVAATLPDFQATYVAHQGGLWLVTADGASLDISQLVAPPPPPPPPDDGKKKKEKGKKEKKEKGEKR
ncbi:MAG: hypothetical protein H6742_02785 [Alphaproteobacteria bacterium]|nr:hypothetical protein [Alphaproteobacteria bacterium]